jgi:ABC-type multidrug transport system ATPase subunit
MSASVTINNLAKRFGDTRALRGVSLEVHRGELFGVIGPDGAGKTTLLRILVTLLVPDAGTAQVLGHDVVKDLWALRQRVGYMAGRFSLYPDLSVEENLRFFASVFGTTIQRERDRIAPIYRQLEPFRDRRAAALSGGMKQKLALCCALVHRPEMLFLDEPTTGVDAVSRREFWELLGELTGQGLTTIVSTPYMDEANRCGRIALIQQGRLLAVDRPAAIVAAFDRPLFGINAPKRYDALRALREYPQTHSIYPFGELLHYTDERTDRAPADIQREVVEFLRCRGMDGVAIVQIEPTIEDSFMARMGAPEGVPGEAA